MAILSGILLVLFIISAVLLVIIVLMQDEQGEGLGGIFGGGGAAPVSGSRSGNILTRSTVILAVVFFVSLFGYAWINRTPESANIEAAARRLETQDGEQILEWWKTDEAIDVPQSEQGQGVVDPEAELETDRQATDDGGSAPDSESAEDGASN
jgi:preprotein translocase subunit SecG